MKPPFTPPVFEPKNPDFREDLQLIMPGQHFMKHIGFELNLVEPGLAEGHIHLGQQHLQQHGYLHGGVSATVCDLVMGFAAWTLVPKGAGVVTADLKTDYHLPGIGTVLYGRGRVVKTGNMLHFCEAELWLDDGPVVVRATSIMCTVVKALQ
ncbi:MAG: hypothetical protein RL160_27 [Bacteroidota bacterium]|jgi:uncharacterized protein (TIGR00369 family)